PGPLRTLQQSERPLALVGEQLYREIQERIADAAENNRLTFVAHAAGFLDSAAKLRLNDRFYAQFRQRIGAYLACPYSADDVMTEIERLELDVHDILMEPASDDERLLQVARSLRDMEYLVQETVAGTCVQELVCHPPSGRDVVDELVSLGASLSAADKQEALA